MKSARKGTGPISISIINGLGRVTIDGVTTTYEGVRSVGLHKPRPCDSYKQEVTFDPVPDESVVVPRSASTTNVLSLEDAKPHATPSVASVSPAPVPAEEVKAKPVNTTTAILLSVAKERRERIAAKHLEGKSAAVTSAPIVTKTSSSSSSSSTTSLSDIVTEGSVIMDSPPPLKNIKAKGDIILTAPHHLSVENVVSEGEISVVVADPNASDQSIATLANLLGGLGRRR